MVRIHPSEPNIGVRAQGVPPGLGPGHQESSILSAPTISGCSIKVVWGPWMPQAREHYLLPRPKTKGEPMPRVDMDKKRAYDRQYYASRSNEAKARKVLLQKKRRINIVKTIQSYKEEKGCVDCGFNNPYALDFDHRDKDLKTFSIGTAVSNAWSIERIMVEVNKCDVRCANCHRIRTASQFNWN